LIRRYDPDIVHGQGADLAGLLAVGCGRPSVVTVHGLLSECAKFQSGLVSRLRAKLAASATERPVIGRAPHLIAISPYVAEYYAREIRGIVHHIPNPVAPGFFQVARRPERGRLIYAGRIANGKGLVELLHAAARSPSAVSQLVLAGATPEPSYERRLRDLVKSLALQDRVTFAGLLTERQLLDEFARAELLVLPSHQETAPMVVQQAMAAGLAVIATTVGGIPHQIQHNVTGLLFEAGDVDTLAGLMGRVGADASLSRRLGDSAKTVAASRYRAHTVAQATLSVYRSVLRVGR
jgi:glycosyltransferase involved in cell wall biosynthesis